MKSQFLIIMIVVILKVIGVANRANSEDCNFYKSEWTFDYTNNQFKLQNSKTMDGFWKKVKEEEEVWCNETIKDEEVASQLIKEGRTWIWVKDTMNEHEEEEVCLNLTKEPCLDLIKKTDELIGYNFYFDFNDCDHEIEFQLINSFNYPTYRCGQIPNYIRI